ncbi:hypothetical protein [Clostridium sp. DJ247]|uniref:hypothetical protein n=1 Tax=Clostridium sp. DJ247 TaxID=2726188 RepID=UPI001629AB6A|nr:hypothetical protein [Clostridium sp. DJ247]MBC2580223.1 hypothetical protein [Clostridium sp. DJ247]
MENKPLDNKPTKEFNSEYQIVNEVYENENMVLIIDEDGTVNSIKYKTDDIT